MTISRRAMFAKLLLASFVGALLRGSPDARAETIQYSYDAQGRVTRAMFSNGVVVDYTYDSAGNRTQVTRSGGSPPPPPPPPPPGFVQTIQIVGSGPANLRTLADAAGYTGLSNATVTFEVGSGVTITGAAGTPAGGIAIDSGVWPTSTYAVALTLTIKTGGVVRGGGGLGGQGGGLGGAGGAGGDAIHCRLPMIVNVDAGAQGRGGGGGGGGGTRVRNTAQPYVWGGGGGGGGQPNGPGGAGGGGDEPGAAGTAGSTSAPGAGGAGAGAAGDGSGGGAFGSQGIASDGAGGAAGYCVRKNGHTVTVNNNGATSGTIG